MIYGLYLSATGVLANSHRQDVIANNLANAETIGFKRDITPFQQRLTAAEEMRTDPGRNSSQLLEALGGGLKLAPTAVDSMQGELEQTDNPSDVAIHGDGYFALRVRGQTLLSRNGQFMLDRQGRLVTATGGYEVLDSKHQPIQLDSTRPIVIQKDGTITQDGKLAAQVGVFGVPDARLLRKAGGTMLQYPQSDQVKPVAAPNVAPGFLERSNVDPVVEITRLMDAQRQLEANANMIRYQDQTLGRLLEAAKV